VLYALGQPSICTCGYVKWWEGVVLSPGNSQHLTDWYTFSHILHGFLFYLALWYFFPRLSVWQRLVLAVGVEVAWEIIENTPMVIEKYREQALAQGYTGDSILNSLSDTLAMIVGFVMAWRWPVWLVVLLTIVLEVVVALLIRDNLTLNILNFIHTFPAISAWQAG
jgi:predicted MFS family arabinose efflux permease